MRILILIIIVGAISCSKKELQECNYIENYYQTIYEAEFQYQLENYEKAFDLYKIAFATCSPINTPVHNEIGKFIEISTVLGHIDMALEFVELNIHSGYELKWIVQDDTYKTLFETDRGKELIKNYETIRTSYLKSVNLDLRKEIQEMTRLDQLYRINNNGPKQDSLDQINTARLIEIFDEYGYPNSNVIGHFSIDRTYTDIGTILLHTSDSIRTHYFIPKLLEYVKNGECPPLRVGNIIDQLQIYNGKPQTHGIPKRLV
jgi:tetratricopeptide (TPR) repeat protein